MAYRFIYLFKKNEITKSFFEIHFLIKFGSAWFRSHWYRFRIYLRMASWPAWQASQLARQAGLGWQAQAKASQPAGFCKPDAPPNKSFRLLLSSVFIKIIYTLCVCQPIILQLEKCKMWCTDDEGWRTEWRKNEGWWKKRKNYYY